MSNAEVDPLETVCAAGASRGAGVELIEPRDVPLGGLRAMRVRRTLPQRRRSFVGAWCFLDHYGPELVEHSGGMNVAAHPHTGLQTVSWLFEGEIEHRDSAGFHAMVRPGEMNLMTAGHGISHSERSTPDTTTLHGVQLWVALPESARHGAKTFEHYEPSPIEGEGWRAWVFLGSLLGETSPVTMFTPLVGAEIMLEPGTSITIAVHSDFEHGVLVDAGEVTVATTAADRPSREGLSTDEPLSHEPVAHAHLGYIAPGASQLVVSAAAGGGPARVILIGGEPFAEEIVMWWNFIGRDHDEIAQARADWQDQIEAAGVGDPSDPLGESGRGLTPEPGRYGLPNDEPEPPLPAPKLPVARLVPRKQPGERPGE